MVGTSIMGINGNQEWSNYVIQLCTKYHYGNHLYLVTVKGLIVKG